MSLFSTQTTEEIVDFIRTFVERSSSYKENLYEKFVKLSNNKEVLGAELYLEITVVDWFAYCENRDLYSLVRVTHATAYSLPFIDERRFTKSDIGTLRFILPGDLFEDLEFLEAKALNSVPSKTYDLWNDTPEDVITKAKPTFA